MDSELREFDRIRTVLSQYRRMCTGEPIPFPEAPPWPRHSRSEAEFDAVVSAAYKLWRESWKLDVGFLLGQRGGSHEAARAFERLVNSLRTAAQHHDNPAATEARAVWTAAACGARSPSTAEEWTACGRALMTELNAAVDCLVAIAAQGRNQPAFRTGWRVKGTANAAVAVTSVIADLGMQLNPGQHGFHVSNVERRLKNYRFRLGETAEDVLAAFAVCSLVAQLNPLPCAHGTLLEELGVLGVRDEAAMALRLAHSVAEISRTHGETYLKLVTSTWTALHPQPER